MRTYLAAICLATCSAGACHLINGLDGYDLVDGSLGGGGNGGAAGGDGGAELFSIAVEIAGLATTLTLELNAAEVLAAGADGSYTFATQLPAGASYEVTLTDPDGERCEASGASGEVAGDVVVTVTCKPTVRPFDPAAANWLDYAAAAGGACDPALAARPADCVHGGERRALYVPGAADCSGVSGSDALGAFVWTCVDTGPYVELVGVLAADKRIADVVDFVAQTFAENAVTITSPAGTVSTDPAIWWSNPVVATGAALALDEPGTIYLLSASSGQALGVAADRVALVIEPDVTLLAAAPAVVADGVDFAWVEGDVQGGVSFANTRVSVLRGMDVAGDTILQSNTAMLVHGVELHGGTNCIDASGNVGLGVELAAIHSCFRAARFVNGSGGYLRESIAANCDQAVIINNATGFAVDRLIVTSTGLAGLNVMASSGVHATRITTASTDNEGVRLECDGCSLRGVTSALVADRGVQLRGSDTWAADLLAYNDGVGIELTDWTGQGRNWIALSTRDGAGGLGIALVNSTVTLGGVVKLGDNATPCAVDALSQGMSAATCDAAGMSTFLLTTGVSSNGVLRNKITADDMANDSDTAGAAAFPPLDWITFNNVSRGWGVDGSPPPNLDNQGRCSAATCRIWDWSLRTGNTVARNQNAAPTGNDVATAGGQTFLVAALELLGDGVGDDDTLCESAERCLFMPNVGAYQGHGDLEAVTFRDGTVSGVTLVRHVMNGT
jgi:hypothetical protein